jgi:hypothetical protein
VILFSAELHQEITSRKKFIDESALEKKIIPRPLNAFVIIGVFHFIKLHIRSFSAYKP